jgi:hypothetical protein
MTPNPQVRVTEGAGNLVELLPTSIDQAPLAGHGRRDLHTRSYSSGAYQARAEIKYRTATGEMANAVSSPASLSFSAQ